MSHYLKKWPQHLGELNGPHHNSYDFFIGSLTGFLSGFLGVGGGFILVPLLIFAGVPAHTAIGSSLAYIIFTGISGAIQHYKQKNCDFKLVLLLICGGVVTAQIGAAMTLYIEGRALEMLLGFLLLGTAIRMLTQKDGRSKSSNIAKMSIRYKIPVAIAIGSVTGFLSGLVGVGGGFLLVPLMILLLHEPIHKAVGTSLIGVVGFATSGVIRHWMIGHIDSSLVGILVAGGIFLAPLGAKASKKTSRQLLRKIFSALLLLFSLKLLIQI